MAIFVFQMKTFSRAAGSRGSRATSAAAYRAGERIRDVRGGATYDHRRRQDVLHKEIVLPAALGATAPGWARDRSSLWNAAELAESRSNARVAREFMVALPHELSADARMQLARGFAQQVSERYGNAVDLVLHAPRHDARNFHAHLLATTREVHAQGLGRKTTLELSGTQRHERGLLRWSEERQWLRERWADLTNQALSENKLSVRVSADYTAKRNDATRLPRIAYYIEQRGGYSFVAARWRAEQASAQAVQQQRSTPLEQVRQNAVASWLALRDKATTADPHQQQLESVRNWLEYRRKAAAQSAQYARTGQAALPDHYTEGKPVHREELVQPSDLDLLL
jgi:hypothetical protein